MKQVILYIATSEDGFIADKEGSVDWLPPPDSSSPEDGTDGTGMAEVLDRIDTILMGSASYKQILGFGDWGWPDKHTYVFTSQALDAALPCITVINESPSEFMSKMNERSHSDKAIWLLGGGTMARAFAKDGFIDEIILTTVPKILGEGIPLGLSFDDFELKSEKSLANGMTQKVYLKKGL